MRALVLALVLCSVVAHADARDDAKREFTAGQADDKKGDYASAIEHYLRAYDFVAHPFALYNVAVDYEQLGKLREAVHYYETYLESPEATDRDRVRKKVDELRNKPSKFEVTTNPDGAKLSVDGQSFATTPFSGRLKGGRHSIVVELDDKRDSKQITVEFGEPVALAFDLGGRPGTIIIQGQPIGADVSIDGEHAGTLPFTKQLPEGPHKIEISQGGYKTVQTEARITQGATTYLRPNLVRGEGVDDGTPAAKAYYELGASGGADVRGNGGAYNLEIGLRALNYEAALAIGQVIGVTSVEFQIRYALGSARVQPIIGAGYSYLKGSSSGLGYEAFAGLRADLVVTDSFGVSLLGIIEARYRTPDNSDLSMPDTRPTGVFPFQGVLQLYYRLNK